MKYQKEIKVPEKLWDSSETVIRWLSQYGVPKGMMNDIRKALLYDAVTEAEDLRYERVYSAVALMLHDEFGFGQQRIHRGLVTFDKICASVLGDNATDWTTIEERLKNETGIVIRSGDEDKRLVMEVGV